MTLTFEELARAADIDVATGAALIAKDVYVDLDVEALLRRFDEMAAPLRGEALAGLPLTEQVAAVSARFRELGFRGNSDDYYDVRNSLLPDVLERRTGIPITLSLVWCELARRAGVVARGVSFPGHFLVRVDGAAGRPIIVDPFNDCRIVDDAKLSPALFEPATARATLVRMLMNLKAIWERNGERMRVFLALDRMVSLMPDSAELRGEREAAAALMRSARNALN